MTEVPHSPVFPAITDAMSDWPRAERRIAVRTPDQIASADAERQGIVLALGDRKPDRAEPALPAHLAREPGVLGSLGGGGAIRQDDTREAHL